jgi:hypothetical protein
VKYSCRARKKILVVRRIVASLVHRVACECTNGVQGGPPTQRDDFTAIRVEEQASLYGRRQIVSHELG